MAPVNHETPFYSSSNQGKKVGVMHCVDGRAAHKAAWMANGGWFTEGQERESLNSLPFPNLIRTQPFPFRLE